MTQARRTVPKRSKTAAKGVAARPAIPDFELAPPEGIPGPLIVADKSDRLGAFVLSLSLFFNDMKTVQYGLFQALNARHDAHAIETRAQLQGMISHLVRLNAGLIFELFEALDTKESQALVQSPEWTALLARMSPKTRRLWADLLDHNKPGSRYAEVYAQSRKVRHALAFHYHSPKSLVDGFLEGFPAVSTEPLRYLAAFSDGKHMEGTRFYFADAAVELALHRLVGLGLEAYAKVSLKATNDINEAVRAIVVGYLRTRGQRPVPFVVPNGLPRK